MLDTSHPEALNDLNNLLRGWNTHSDAEAFDRQALAAHLVPQRAFETGLMRIDEQHVDRDPDASRDLALTSCHLGTNGRGVVVSPANRPDVESRVEDRTDETGHDSGRCHAGNHDWGAHREGERVACQRAVYCCYKDSVSIRNSV